MALIKRTWIAGGICIGLLTAPLAHALSIGGTSLHSYLAQPLDAEISLQGTGGMLIEDIKARVASPEEFEKLDIAWDDIPVRLKLVVEEKDGKMVIHATTPNPIEQPYLQFPLEVRAGRLKLVKEITLLLDPPGHGTRPPSAATAQTPPQPQSRFAPPAPVDNRPAAAGAQTYRVRPGDTLWPIAQSLRPRDVSNYQMMIALQRANPGAFPHGNVNEIQSGSLLTVPSDEQVRGIGQRDALREFRRQMQAWKTGEAVAAAPPRQATETPPATPAAEQESPVSVTRQAMEPAETAAEPKLEVLPPPEDSVAGPQGKTADRETMQRELLLSEEQLRSQELEQNKISEQIANLQAQMEQMQALLKLKDQQIAALQSIVETRGLAAQGAAAPAPATPADARETTPPAPAAVPEQAVKPTPVTVASGPMPQREVADTDFLSSLPIWVWVLSGGVLILLLALLLKRREAEGESRGDLPLASYPEVARPAPKPYAEHAAVSVPESAEPDIPEVPEVPEVQEAAVSLHHGDIQTHDMIEDDADIKALAEEIDLDLPFLEDGELPELDENLVGTQGGQDADQAEEQDEIAAFWDQLDIPEMQNPDATLATGEDTDQSLEILLEMARAYVELGDKEEAIGILEQALAASDDEERRARIQDVLDEIS